MWNGNLEENLPMCINSHALILNVLNGPETRVYPVLRDVGEPALPRVQSKVWGRGGLIPKWELWRV